MKKLITFSIFLLLAGASFAQFKVYSSNLLKFGNTLEQPILKKGFEVKMDTVLFTFPSGGGLRFYLQDNNTGLSKPIGSSFSIDPNFPPVLIKNSVTIIRGQKNNDLQLGTNNYEMYSVFSKKYYSSISTGISSLSDYRYKENIKDLASSLEIIKGLRAVTFDYKQQTTEETEEFASLRKNKVGFIAQELLESIPEAVNYQVEDDIYTVDYTVLIPFLVKAIQEQQTQIEELQGQLKNK